MKHVGVPDAVVVASLTITGEHLAASESGDPDVLTTCAGASFGAHMRGSTDVFVCDIVVDRVGVHVDCDTQNWDRSHVILFWLRCHWRYGE